MIELRTAVHVINEEKMIYKISIYRELQSSTLGFTYDLDLVAGYDYINPDENDIQGFVEAKNFTDDVQSDILTVYPLSESLGERLEELGYTVIDINKYKIHESKLEEPEDIKPLKGDINLENPIEIENLIKETESGMYGSHNDKGESVTLFIQQGQAMDIHVFQSNGWVRIDEYNMSGLKVSESFSGRWDK
ncbi:hypothetical protein [Bacillus cereus]|uniref:hypothetical protein n=1 Tax=Bacillus cereus group TaxID=86661 RepID=UPI000A654317|nr:hypothetical protein [Bacillus cereus]